MRMFILSGSRITCHAVLIPPSFFYHATPTTAIYTLSLHDALPIYEADKFTTLSLDAAGLPQRSEILDRYGHLISRSEEHTSELQSRVDLVCRLLLEKKKNTTTRRHSTGTH